MTKASALALRDPVLGGGGRTPNPPDYVTLLVRIMDAYKLAAHLITIYSNSVSACGWKKNNIWQDLFVKKTRITQKNHNWVKSIKISTNDAMSCNANKQISRKWASSVATMAEGHVQGWSFGLPDRI